MKVVIIEDEQLNALRLEKMLKEMDSEIQVAEVLDSVEAAVDYLQSAKGIDLIFLDIQLTDGLGFDILPKIDATIPLIITTAYDQYAIEAYKFLSLDYLLKPIKESELKKSLKKFHQFYKKNKKLSLPVQQIKDLLQPENYTKVFICKRGKNRYPVKTDQIAYFYSEDRDVWVKTFEGKEFNISVTLDQLDKQVDPQHFFRANRKLISSKQAILKFEIMAKSRIKVSLDPETPFEVIISSEKAALFKNWIAG